MPGLPEGWEWDYDGRRWFYKYKPTGHIQYHFPSEGDEFPDYVDAAAPAPDLAPEERLESQQQMKRHGVPLSSSTAAALGGNGTGKSFMSASARPISTVWNDDGGGGGGGEGDETVFQPESFMFLGPGTYNDVSPLVDEEEEAARRVVAGGGGTRSRESPAKGAAASGAGTGTGTGIGTAKGVSPLASKQTTPQVKDSEASTEPIMGDPITGDPITVPRTVPEEPPEPAAHLIDGREMPHELPVEEPPRFNPVGVVAEMASGDTAPSRSETHPDPIEMGDHTILAPIETTAPGGLAELPEKSSPVDDKSNGQGSRGPPNNQRVQPQVTIPPLRAAQKPPGEFVAYRPYNPGVMVADSAPSSASTTAPPMRPPLGDRAATIEPNSRFAPAHTLGGIVIDPAQQNPQLSHAPSVLKPARNTSPPKAPLEELQLPGTRNNQESSLSKVPSVLRPARGRAPSLPGTQPSQAQLQGHGYAPPQPIQHPPALVTGPKVPPKEPLTSEEPPPPPAMGIQRVSTIADQNPSQRPMSMAPGGYYQGFHVMQSGQPPQQQQQPFQNPPQPRPRPASVMPQMMGGVYHHALMPQPPHNQLPGRPGPGLPQQPGVAPYPEDMRVAASAAPRPLSRIDPYAQPGNGPLGFYEQPMSAPPVQPPMMFPPPAGSFIPGQNGPSMGQPPMGQPRELQQEPSRPGAGSQRHSSFSPSDVSPLGSRSTSLASLATMQTPSPVDPLRRGSSSTSLSQYVNSSPSPGTYPDRNSVSPLVPGNRQSYFPPQSSEGHGGHAVAAQSLLRKSSTGRPPQVQEEPRRNSMGDETAPLPQHSTPGQFRPSQHPLQQGSTTLGRSQSVHQTSQGSVIAPHFRPQQQQVQGLHRIEEQHDEGLSRSSTQATRRSSLASIPHTSPSLRRQSLQPVPGMENIPMGQMIPPGRGPPQGYVPPPGQASIKRKPSNAQVPNSGQQLPPNGQVPPLQGHVPLQQVPLQRMPSNAQANPPVRTSLDGRAPPQAQMQPPNIQMPPQGQIPPQGQMAAPGQMPPPGQSPHQQPPPQGQLPPSSQVPAGKPQGWQPNAQQQPPSAKQDARQKTAEAKTPAPKEKKWRKWLKGSKSSSSNDAAPRASSPAAPQAKPPPAPVSNNAPKNPPQPQGVLPPGPPASMPPQPSIQGHVMVPLMGTQSFMPQVSGQVHGQQPPMQQPPIQQPSNMQPPPHLQPPPLQQTVLQQPPMQQAPLQPPTMQPPSMQPPPMQRPPEQPHSRQSSMGRQSPAPTDRSVKTVSPVETITVPVAKTEEDLAGMVPVPAVTEPPAAPLDQTLLQTTPSPEPSPMLSYAVTPEGKPLPSPSPPPTLQRAPSSRRDSISDTASLFSTIEMSEAKPQPVLRPQVIQVQRRPQDLPRPQMDEATPSLPSHRFATTQPLPISQPSPPSPIQRQHTPQPVGAMDDLAPKPLFSGHNSPASNNGERTEVLQDRKEASPPVLVQQTKWAMNPAADYSGGDWGDDDEWGY